MILGGHLLEAFVPFFKLFEVLGTKILQLTIQPSSASIGLVGLFLSYSGLKTEFLLFKGHTLYNRNRNPKNIIGRLIVLDVFSITIGTTRID